MIDVDIPRLSFSGIQFGDWCFDYTYSLQFSSTNSPISLSFDAAALPAHIVSINDHITINTSTLLENPNELIILFGYNNITSFNISNNETLKSIWIGKSCFGKVRVFDLDGLSELENVVVERESFRIDGYERSDGTYRIVNCPKLNLIQIGYESFEDYHSFELNNLPSLQFIEIGHKCFYWAPSFSLTGLIDGLV